MSDYVYTTDEVAAILKVTRESVQGYISKGVNGVRLTASRLGRMYRVQPADLETFVQETQEKQNELTSTKYRTKSTTRNASKAIRELQLKKTDDTLRKYKVI